MNGVRGIGVGLLLEWVFHIWRQSVEMEKENVEGMKMKFPKCVNYKKDTIDAVMKTKKKYYSNFKCIKMCNSFFRNCLPISVEGKQLL